MASMKQTIIVLLSIFTVSIFIKSSHAGVIAIYWGQNLYEGTLQEACDSGDYEIVLLSFLTVFGSGRNPNWNFAGHCGDWSPCTKLEPEIKYCQGKGVKVFLSLGGDSYEYSLSSSEDAKNVAKYLYDNFLNGQYGPLGSVTLDGIDLDIEHGSELYYDDLVKELDALRQEKKFYLSAAPQCFFPDRYLDSAIRTGLLDYVFVQFYNNPPCQYSNGNTANLFNSWAQWSSYIPANSTLFLGLPATEAAAPSKGYIPPEVLKSEVLPYVKEYNNYGGVMLWSRYYDVQTNPTYSHQIKDSTVSMSPLLSVASISDAIFECVKSTLNRMLPKHAPLRLSNL